MCDLVKDLNCPVLEGGIEIEYFSLALANKIWLKPMKNQMFTVLKDGAIEGPMLTKWDLAGSFKQFIVLIFYLIFSAIP